jgi:hypothetical protein
MKPGKLDLPTIWRGCDWGPVTLKWKDQNGDPLDISEWQAVAQSLNINLNPSIVDGAAGETQLSLTRDETSVLKLGLEKWDWIWQRPGGLYRFPPFLSGKVEIKEPVSGLKGSAPPPPPPLPPDVPVAIGATAILSNRFHANWMPSNRATAYNLDVATDTAFANMVPGFRNLNVGNVTTFLVNGLTGNTTYHYRVRARNSGGTTQNSNIIHVTTLIDPPPENDDFADNILMEGLAGSRQGTTIGATRQTGEPAGENSVWYRWRLSGEVLAAVWVDGTVSRISVFTDGDPVHPSVANLVHVADSVVSGGVSIAGWHALQGVFYRIRVFKSTGTAPFLLHWTYEV